MTGGDRGIVDAVTRRGFYYGWIVVAVGFVMQMITAVATQGLATYVVPFAREFGWSQATIGLGRSLHQLDAALGPFSGPLVDRIGPRRMMLIGVCTYAVALALFSRIETVWDFFIASGLMAVANAFCGLLVVSVAVNHWFHRQRTTALGLATLGLAVCGATFVPLLVLAQGTYGWRAAALGAAAFVLVIGLPAAWVVRDQPERYDLLPDGDGRTGDAVVATGAGATAVAAVRPPGMSLHEAVRTRGFWTLAAATSAAMMGQTAAIVYQFAHIELRTNRESAALVLVVINIFNVVGRLAGGYVGDRVPKHQLLGFALLGSAVALVILASSATLVPFLAYGSLFGLCWGIRTPVNASIMAEHFGRQNFGRIAGTLNTIVLPFAVLAPVGAGAVADAAHDYAPAFLMLVGIFLAASVLYFRTPRRDAVRA